MLLGILGAGVLAGVVAPRTGHYVALVPAK
jgi:hypothetical protein